MQKETKTMADNILLKTWTGELNAPLHDAIVRDTLTQMSGIYKGCGVSYSSGNVLHLEAGYGMIKGRLFEIYDTDLQVSLPSSGVRNGRVYVHMDLGNADEPIKIMTATAATLPDLECDENCNFDNGIYEIELCTFKATTVAITNINNTATDITGVLNRLIYGGYLDSPYLNDSVMSFPAGVIKNQYGDGFYTVMDFPAEGIRTRLYDPNDVLIKTSLMSFPDGTIKIENS